MALILEPFHHGSHKYWCDVLASLGSNANPVHVVGMPGGSKWHWRMLASAAHFAMTVTDDQLRHVDTVVVSAMTNLAELAGLLPALATKRKVLYFHENQLEYPRSGAESRKAAGQADFNLVWNQIASCLCADQVLFNSEYNLETFYSQIGPFMNRIPKGARPPPIDVRALRSKSQVLYIPITVPLRVARVDERPKDRPLHLVWAHRWEHDKNPDGLLELLAEFNKLDPREDGKPHVQVSVLGEVAPATEEDFAQKRAVVASDNVRVLHWGRVQAREDYLDILREADVALSTSEHEFFGIAMVEAATCGCFPLCPKRLSYPELFPKDCLYNTDRQLFKAVKAFSVRPELARKKMNEPEWQERLLRFQWSNGLGASARAWSATMFPTSNLSSS